LDTVYVFLCVTACFAIHVKWPSQSVCGFYINFVCIVQVSERFAAVDMDLSEDSVDLEEAVMNGIHLLNVCSVCVCTYVTNYVYAPL